MRQLASALKSGTPILIDPSKAQGYLDRVASLDISTAKKAEDMKEVLTMLFGEQPEMTIEDDVAIIPIKGVIGSKLTALEKMMGATDVEDIKGWAKHCLESDDVKTVILDVDSPGGTVTGVPEVAKVLRALGQAKHTIAYTDGEACSAAYWMASQCNEFYATPSATVGSVGVYVAMPDYTKAFDMEGIKMDVIKAGKLKAIGVPGTSMTEEQRKHVQDDVNEIHTDFKNDVKMVRTEVEDDHMEGQGFSGKKSAEHNMVTGLADDLEEALGRSAQWRAFTEEKDEHEKHEDSETAEEEKEEHEKESE